MIFLFFKTDLQINTILLYENCVCVYIEQINMIAKHIYNNLHDKDISNIAFKQSLSFSRLTHRINDLLIPKNKSFRNIKIFNLSAIS